MLLVVLEHDRGTLGEAGREALTFGRTLAAKMDAEMHAAVIGGGAGDAAGPDSVAAEAGNHGAVRVYTVDGGVLSDFGPEAWGESIAQITRFLGPDAVLACGSERGNEVMAQAAVRLDAPLVTNCADITPPSDEGGQWSMTRVQWGGSLLEDSTLSTAGPALLTCALHTVASSPVKPAPDAPPEVQAVEVDLPPELARTVVKERVVLEAGVTLPTAPVVVGGGRGVGSAEGFAPLEELAELLGGRVGCSRAVTNNGWRPHSDQVGQTGTRIAPEIYIASGISGAIQHWVGAMGSKHILAINIDPEANMVVKADWAVVGDLHQVIPAISAEIRRRWS